VPHIAVDVLPETAVLPASGKWQLSGNLQRIPVSALNARDNPGWNSDRREL
jgi:hypothetical protein